MFNNSFNKRGQIGETMTWMIATIIIIVILAISIFVVQFNMNNALQPRNFLSNDLLVTKSAVAFLKSDYNFELVRSSINNDNYGELKLRVEVIRKIISIQRSWNFRIFVNDKLRSDSVIHKSNPSNDNFLQGYAYLIFNLNSDKVILKFDEGRAKNE